MSYSEFKDSLQANVPPAGLSELQLGLWHIAKGNWQEAHTIAQDHEGETDFDRLHAYVHRIEGDAWNADYWYQKAGTKMPEKSIGEELELLIHLWC
ncbi:hypothetical protein A8C56_00710 [Niabella ginsenosidivorans]|uniref:Uncharacterized protein n=1 Tax=Niabella ginsenosidivorans TaxID=1176587 RepID=A0A1A9HZ34_9BACT|nr:hypothetical protein [Niabella ginsenosidivorans]ANH79692.1 hypothetical protein A8C56_00710 [Niabella ginsenosidivorans]